jgi:hypothetical protein
MGQWGFYFNLLAAAANVLTIVASAIAILVFILGRKKISAAIELLLTFSFQTTLSELKEKLERLNEYNANEPTDLAEIRNILHEIAGQIKGNERLKRAVPELASKVEAVANGKKLSEPSKRSLVSELREHLRNIQVSNIEPMIGKENE